MRLLLRRGASALRNLPCLYWDDYTIALVTLWVVVILLSSIHGYYHPHPSPYFTCGDVPCKVHLI